MKDTVYHIGRDKEFNEIHIIDDSISEKHAQIVVDENGDTIIIDLASNNSIKVNNKKLISPLKIVKDDIISIGSFKCLFQDVFKAINLFDFENQKGKKRKSIQLISSVSKNRVFNKSESSNTKRWYNNQKFLTIILIVLSIVIVAFLAFFFLDQQTLRKKSSKYSQNKNDIENTNGPQNEKNKNPKKTNKQRTDVTYDFSCLEQSNDQGSNKVITNFGDFTRDIQSVILNDVNVTVQEEQDHGEEEIKMLKEDYNFIESGEKLNKLRNIVIDLNNRLAKPRGFNYKIYLVDDEQINALTVGGHIVFFTGLYDFCENDNEITSVVAHEIAHNELGHITSQLKKNKSASSIGVPEEVINILLGAEKKIFASFNQKQELEADLFGIDLMYPTQYKTCSAINLWQRMAEQVEGRRTTLSNFQSSHPYSESRAKCIKNHLESNYDKSCNN